MGVLNRVVNKNYGCSRLPISFNNNNNRAGSFVKMNDSLQNNETATEGSRSPVNNTESRVVDLL
jgi:hypothetical protein